MHRGEFILIIVWAIGLTCFLNQIKVAVLRAKWQMERDARVAEGASHRKAWAEEQVRVVPVPMHRVCRYDCLIQFAHRDCPPIHIRRLVYNGASTMKS